MADEMALFEAEIGEIGSLTEDTHRDEIQDTGAERSHTDDVEQHGAEEAEEVKPKPNLIEEAKRLWKQRQIEEVAAEAAAWTEHKDAGSGSSYYFNNITKISAWTLPPDAKAPKWTVNKDSASGHFYFHNNENGQSTWERPAELGKEAPATVEEPVGEPKPVATGAAASPSTAANGAEHDASADSDVDEVIDLAAETAFDKVFARVTAESEEGTSVVGFHLKLDTPFGKVMTAWSDYQELDVESFFFELGGVLLDPFETPDTFGWTGERGVLKIEAKPCQEIEVEDEEANPVELSKRDEIKLKRKALEEEAEARWKKKEQKDRKRDMEHFKEEQGRLQQVAKRLGNSSAD